MNKSEHQAQEILEKYDRESVTRTIRSSWLKYLVGALAVAYSLFHVYITFYPMPTILQRSVHVSVACALIFLLYPSRSANKHKGVSIFDGLFFILSILTSVYLFVEYLPITTTRGGIPNDWDIVMAIIMVVLVLETTRRITGWILPIFAGVCLLYPFISHLSFMPDSLLTRPYDLGDIFGQLYLKTEGIFSTAIGASVSFVFLFILFGAFLERSGMGKLFNDLALALAGNKQGGPAKVAVISSGFMGSINGAAVANVVGTGAFTIPLMKKIGYDKNFAGAVEASASVGGQILPPIMGASAFIMSETTGVSYGTIALAALLPALLYYLGVIAQVHFRAGRFNLKGLSKDQLPELKKVLKLRGHMLLPIIFLVVCLANAIPVGYCACYTILFTIVVSWFKKETRMGPKAILEALISGAKNSLSVTAACAVVGIVIGVVNLTSFGTVLISSIISLGAGSLFITLLLTMVASIVLGMGLPSIPAYIITATMAAPALAQFDVPILVAHMFVFYFGIFANITPPVALAAFAGAGISGGDPMKTGFYSLKLALAGFIIPFMFVYNPQMLMIDITGVEMTAKAFSLPAWHQIVFVIVTSVIGVISLSSAVEGYFSVALSWFERVLLAVGGIMLIAPEAVTDMLGMCLVAICLLINYKKSCSVKNA
ncbi:TRAP transporter permease [Basilea psittacipulmonis]|uniref:C4-dicarboxylate ABC transporter permease n=2 Tax=Basilea TaxID=1472344 RepID=A0A077DHM7_9BURK|nr:TRAP transporter permease [Basilea psittacipulmonis]AIL33067.1 C4-dicarboxylate ABC transporter permease [Basilea psittacipulmonis DSM 24701]